jgi:hypothetical protein
MLDQIHQGGQLRRSRRIESPELRYARLPAIRKLSNPAEMA